MRKQEPADKYKCCGSCAHFGPIYLEYLHFEFSGPFVCYSEKANPDRKDPKDGKGMFYYRDPCRNWEW